MIWWLKIKHVFETIDGTPEIATSVASLLPRNDTVDDEKINGGTDILACV